MAAPIDEDTLVSLSAFLDGELDVAQEQALLARLEREPALADALEALARLQQATHRVMNGGWPTDDVDADVLEAVFAALPAEAATGAVGAAVLAALVADHEATQAQAERLDALAATTEAAAVVETLATIEATRAIAARPGAACSPALAHVREEVASQVAQIERVRALAAAAADGALDDAEATELWSLVHGDDALVQIVVDAVAARVGEAGPDRAVGEALRAFAEAPVVVSLAARAGSAAVQAIAAGSLAATTQPTRATAPSTAAPWSWWGAVRQAFAGGFVPVFGAAAAAVAFFVLGGDAPATPDEARLARLHEAQGAFMEVLEPIALASGMGSETTSLPVLPENAADVQAIDAAGTTMVFETEASHITVIWVAGLDEDDVAGEQGT
jgi:hypothetical protein